MPTAPPPDVPEDDPPVAGDTEWRLEVGRTRAAHLRRPLPFTLNVGWPAGDRVSATVSWPVPREYDAGLRFDLLDALLEEWLEKCPGEGPESGTDRVCVWVTRPGVPSVHDQDLAWYAAAEHVCGAREVRLLAFRAVTHTGWLDVVTGEARVWRRLRL